MTRILLFSALYLTSFASIAQSVLGRWISVDDESGKDRSVVEITKAADGTLNGTIVKVFPQPGEDPDPICDECRGPEKDQRIVGMRIIKGLSERDGDGVWSGGSILDPETGRVYDSKIWLENGALMVRGYLLFFYRTQKWRRE